MTHGEWQPINRWVHITPTHITRDGLSIMAINVLGLEAKDGDRRRQIKSLTEQRDPDIIIIIEANSTLEFLADRYQNFMTEAMAPHNGVRILVRKGLTVARTQDPGTGRYLGIEIKRPKINIIGVHMASNREADAIATLVGERRWDTPTVIYADTNQWGQKLLGLPVNWSKLDWSWQGQSRTAPDWIGTYKCQGCLTGGPLISDHRALLWEGKCLRIKDQWSTFPRSKEACYKDMQRHSGNWPEEAGNSTRPISRNQRLYMPLTTEEKLAKNYNKTRRLRFLNAINRALRKHDSHLLHGLIKHGAGMSKEREVTNLIINGEVKAIGNCQEEVMAFFKNIYARKGKDVKANTIPFIPVMDGVVTPSNNKAMGPDCNPDSIFDQHWEGTKKERVRNWNDPDLVDRWRSWGGESRTEIPEYMKTARLVLLSKSGKPTTTLDDVRPISVTNIEYKQIEINLLGRLGDRIWRNIPKCQVGFRKHKSTQDNIISVKAWMHIQKTGKERRALMSIDLVKAYDHVDREILLDKVKRIVSKEEGGEYRDLLYNTHIQYGQAVFKSNTGVPQGSILSPMMFDLYIAEPIRRLKTLGRVWAYADNIIIGCDTHKIPLIEREIESWEDSLNLKVNWAKCDILFHGSPRKTAKAQRRKVAKYLGVQISWNDERTARSKLEAWRKKRKARWRSWPNSAQLVASLWWDWTDCIYRFYGDFIRGSLSTGDLDGAFLKATRARLNIPNYISNENLSEVIGMFPGQTCANRAVKEGLRMEGTSQDGGLAWLAKDNEWRWYPFEKGIKWCAFPWRRTTENMCR